MKTYFRNIHFPLAVLGVSFFVMTGCSDNDNPAPAATTPMATFEVKVTNVTNNQQLTPLAVIAHHSNYAAWQLGSAASSGLEMLAESGSPDDFLTAADASADVVATVSVAGPAPGGSETATITAMEVSDLEITVATMLAVTNDAFTGVSKVDVGAMVVGDSITMKSRVYDAGTEVNSEAPGTMPGLNGGEGFNAELVDTGFISVHAGVLTTNDGLTSSALDESYRWLGAAAKITITRTQ